MTVYTDRGSSIPGSSGTWGTTANAYDGTPGTDTGTYATWVSSTGSSSAWIEVGGYDFETLIPADATINTVSVNVRHKESSTSRISSVDVQLYDGGTPIGSSTSVSRSTADTTAFITVSPTLAQLRSSTLKVRVTATKSSHSQSTTFSLDFCDIDVDYTPAGGGGGGGGFTGTWSAGDVTEYESAWDTATSPKTVAPTTAVDDLMVVLFGCEADMDTTATSMNASGTLTWTEQEDVGASSRGRVGLWTAPGAAATGWTLTGTKESSGSSMWWGMDVLRFTNSAGAGVAESKTNAAANAVIDITTTVANSAIAVICVDWTALEYASRNWNSASAGTGTELAYFRNGSHYTVFVGFYPDAGAAGLKTVGCLVGDIQGGHSIAAVEIKPSAGGGGGFDPKKASMLLAFV